MADTRPSRIQAREALAAELDEEFSQPVPAAQPAKGAIPIVNAPIPDALADHHDKLWTEWLASKSELAFHLWLIERIGRDEERILAKDDAISQVIAFIETKPVSLPKALIASLHTALAASSGTPK